MYGIEGLVDKLFSTKDAYTIVVTPNVDHMVRVNRDTEFKRLYQQAEISVNDSRILSKLCRLAGINLGSVIPGSDLTRVMIERIAGSDLPITIIGCSDSTVEIIRNKYRLGNAAHYNPPMGFINEPDEIKKSIDFILANPARFIFFAVGSPRQEILAQKAKDAGASGVGLCIGASLSFLSGEEKRAPQLIQKLSLEWLFRLMQSPRRLAKRYLIDGLRIFPILFRERFSNRLSD